jgi:hypothetical protein
MVHGQITDFTFSPIGPRSRDAKVLGERGRGRGMVSLVPNSTGAIPMILKSYESSKRSWVPFLF